MCWRRAVLVEAEELLLDTAVAECGQNGRDGPIGVLQLTIQPLVRSLVVLLLDDVLVQLLQYHLLLLAIKLRILLQGLLELRLLLEQLLPLC